MAQAIVETNGGTSRLARESNNHFGIKCKSHWAGFTYYMPDDDRDADGNLIPSCFRQYISVLDSYRDHSVFLLYTPHYSSLFTHERTDYTSWSKGLQMCGYATDPRYAEKLIKTIELYQLEELDLYTVQYVERDDLMMEQSMVRILAKE
jgi:flagellum-specific peptidoglycan hydrolase FlgJ